VGHSGHALADVTVQCLWLDGYGGSQVRRFHTLDDEIYVPVSDDYLYAFDARGNLRWKVPYNSGHAGAPVVVDLANREQLVLSAQEQALWAFAHDDGTPLWYVPLDSPSLGSPAVANDTI
jgi:outer membrane protein assembly factor BamB